MPFPLAEAVVPGTQDHLEYLRTSKKIKDLHGYNITRLLTYTQELKQHESWGWVSGTKLCSPGSPAGKSDLEDTVMRPQPSQLRRLVALSPFPFLFHFPAPIHHHIPFIWPLSHLCSVSLCLHSCHHHQLMWYKLIQKWPKPLNHSCVTPIRLAHWQQIVASQTLLSSDYSAACA